MFRIQLLKKDLDFVLFFIPERLRLIGHFDNFTLAIRKVRGEYLLSCIEGRN